MKNAIFIVGCPNSGKDIVIKDICEKFDLQEYTFDQVKKYIEKNKINENFVIKGNAYEIENILEINNLLENKFYKTSMVYVDIEEETIAKRKITLDENKKIKFKQSKENIQKFYEVFESFFMFDNNNSIRENQHQFIECEQFIFSILDNISFIKEKTNKKLKDYVYKNFNLDKEESKKKTPKSFYSQSPLKPDGYNEYDIRASGSSNVIHYGEDIGSPESLMTITGMGFSNRDDIINSPPTVMSTPKKTDHPRFNSPAEPAGKNTWKRTKNVLFRKQK